MEETANINGKIVMEEKTIMGEKNLKTPMEEKPINGKESLELISQMIQTSKRNLEVGDGNRFLYWGYFTAALSVVIFALIITTRSAMWNWGWFLMFVFQGYIDYIGKKNPRKVVTYTDKVVGEVWLIMSCMFMLSVVALLLFAVCGVANLFSVPGINYHGEHFIAALMMPLSLLYTGIGVSITGVIIKEKSLVFSSVFAFLVAFYMFFEISLNHSLMAYDILLFGFSFVVMMVIPGHILVHKAKQSNNN
jgi:hypothetical protein